MSRRRLLRVRRPASLWRDNRTTTLLELAIVGPLFMIFLLLIFEVAYDQFLQEVLESTLDYTAHQVAVGNTADQGVLNGATFIANDFCSNDFGLLNCGNVFIRVQRFMPSTTCNDLYPATSGTLPATQTGGKWSLSLGNFVSPNGTGTGGAAGPSEACMSSGSSGANDGYCNAGPSEFIIMTAIYIAPSFVTALLPPAFTYTYNSHYVRAPFAAEAFETEPYTAAVGAAHGPQC